MPGAAGVEDWATTGEPCTFWRWVAQATRLRTAKRLAELCTVRNMASGQAIGRPSNQLRVVASPSSSANTAFPEDRAGLQFPARTFRDGYERVSHEPRRARSWAIPESR